MDKKYFSSYLKKFSKNGNLVQTNKNIFYLDEISKILIIEFKEDITSLKTELKKRFKKKCIFNNKYILIYNFVNSEGDFFFLNSLFLDILEFDLNSNKEVIDSGYSLFNVGKIKLKEQRVDFNLVNKNCYIYESDLKFVSLLNDVFLTSEYLINKFNEKFILEVYNLLKIEINFLEDYSDYEYSACAYKFLMKIYILKQNLDYENMLYLLLHEIGHFYYWKYNKIKINSNEFFKDIKKNYISLQKKYINYTYYFKFDICEKYKWNKREEYFSEIFSLYCNNLLDKEDKLIFEKYICFNN